MICNTNNWGPPLWGIIHLLTILVYMEKKNIEKLKKFLESLQYLLPCQYCRDHYIENFNIYLKNGTEWRKEIFSSKKIIIYCMIILHQKVNIQNNKNIYSIHHYYNYWMNKKFKKKHLKIYINKLKMCNNIPPDIFSLIDKVKIMD